MGDWDSATVVPCRARLSQLWEIAIIIIINTAGYEQHTFKRHEGMSEVGEGGYVNQGRSSGERNIWARPREASRS